MDDAPRQNLMPGQRVTVVQQMQIKGWTNRVTGTVRAYEQRKTGSWFAHAKDDRLWLDRLVLERDDGEIVSINLDQYTRIEPAPPPPAPDVSVPRSTDASDAARDDAEDGVAGNPEAA